MKRRLHAAIPSLVLLGLVTAPAPASAGDPNLADYVFDGSRIFWFEWTSDTHIDTLASASEEDRLGWATGEAVSVIRPFFIVVTGDLTDSTDGIIYGTGPHDSEWISYRGIVVDDHGMGAEFYFDVPGNHDAYGDGTLAFYRRYSVQGTADDQMQHQWRLDLPFGSYHFVSVATPANDGLQWPFDNKEFTVEEMDQTQAFFDANRDVRLTMVFGHHDFVGVDRANVLQTQMIEAGAAHYFQGHEHDVGVRIGTGNILRFRVNSLGQAGSGHFGVVAVDADAVSYNLVSADDPWPLVVVTAPVDARLGPGNDTVNPFAPPVTTDCAEAPVRALVFDSSPVTAVRFNWDGGEWLAMAQWPGEEAQWRGRFDAGTLSTGLHTLTVEATGSATRSMTIQVDAIADTCNLGPEDPPPGADADADADADGDADAGADADADADADAEAEAEASADADADGDADADADADAHPDVTGDTASDAAGDGGEVSLGGGGCGCRAAGPSSGSAWACAAAIVASLVLRRRRAR